MEVIDRLDLFGTGVGLPWVEFGILSPGDAAVSLGFRVCYEGILQPCAGVPMLVPCTNGTAFTRRFVRRVSAKYPTRTMEANGGNYNNFLIETPESTDFSQFHKLEVLWVPATDIRQG